MAVVRTLCRQAILLESGHFKMFAAVNRTVEHYLTGLSHSDGVVQWTDAAACPQDEFLRLWGVRVCSRGEVTGEADMGEEIQVLVDYEVLRSGTAVMVSIHVNSAVVGCLFASSNAPSANAGQDELAMRPHAAGRYQSCMTIPANFLNEGSHSLSVFMLTGGGSIRMARTEILSFNAVDTGAMRKEHTGVWIGAIRPRLPWSTRAAVAEPVL